ncbi:hypothetical protein [Lysinibacillus sp. FJAT-14745]|uniref:hypothetical protein n=1 Tax=Lysinibacillus sp. FJAT-14745 TaxID=1704289 RepID=UPI0012E1DECC|nr:hypothetical protein [Lysinibacillus sp. FJAT-14745]
MGATTENSLHKKRIDENLSTSEVSSICLFEGSFRRFRILSVADFSIRHFKGYIRRSSFPIRRFGIPIRHFDGSFRRF